MNSAVLSSNDELSECEDFEDFDDYPDQLTDFESSDINLPSSNTLDFSRDDTLFNTRKSIKKISKITEDQTTENYFKTFDGFFTEMMGKVKSLKNTPALDPQNQNSVVDIDEQKLFKHLKETPEVKEKLDIIKGLDEDIENIIDVYKMEKAERIQTQLEMCEEMQRDNLPDRETALFLSLCNFELSEAGDKVTKEESVPVPKESTPAGPDQFIRKNIELAREGFLANISLTDEEKSKIEELLLEDEEDCSPVVDEHNMDDHGCLASNAYFFSEDERARIVDINSQLEKFAIDEKLNEKDDKSDQDYGTMTDFLLGQSIKRLESKLSELHDKENEDVAEPYLNTDTDTEQHIDNLD